MKIMELVELVNNPKNKMLKADQLQQMIQKGLDAKRKLTVQESRKHERQKDLQLYQELSGPGAAQLLDKCIEKAGRSFSLGLSGGRLPYALTGWQLLFFCRFLFLL